MSIVTGSRDLQLASLIIGEPMPLVYLRLTPTAGVSPSWEESRNALDQFSAIVFGVKI